MLYQLTDANCTSSIEIKATITDPAAVAMPAVIKINNSLFESCSRV